jgi:hypothetical protein
MIGNSHSCKADTPIIESLLDVDFYEKRLGIYSIWVDVTGVGNRRLGAIKPDRIIRSLSELKLTRIAS